MSWRDPVGAIVVLHELIGQLLECLNPEIAGRLVDPLVLGGPFPQQLLDIRAHWSLVREVLLLRYLQELDDLHKQYAVLGPESFQRYLASAAARKSLESVNQLRNHLIRGYGQVVLKLDRQELFRVPPLFDVTRELCRLLARLVPERRQIGAGSPIPLHRLQTGDLLQIPPGPLLRQVRNWIEAVPVSERLLPDPQAEANRLFLEILYGAADLLDFLLNDERSPLFVLGGQVVLAGEEDRELREEIELDRTPLRVELRRDFEPVDRLTGLQSKNEYLRIAPTLFRQEQLAGRELALLVMDLDRFKTVNDSLGHQFGDSLLALAGQAVLACCREEDPAARFGGTSCWWCCAEEPRPGPRWPSASGNVSRSSKPVSPRPASRSCGRRRRPQRRRAPAGSAPSPSGSPRVWAPTTRSRPWTSRICSAAPTGCCTWPRSWEAAARWCWSTA